MKGQIIAFDMAASVFILVLFLSLISYIWVEHVRKVDSASSFSDKLSRIVPASEVLITFDDNVFDNENLSYLHFVYTSNVINSSALYEFVERVRTNYSSVKGDLGLSNNYYFEVYNTSSNSTILRQPNISAESFPSVDVVVRYAILNDSVVKVILGVIE